jgi:hypothetical protein
MIIAISGKFRSGKDTVAKMISLKLIAAGYKTRRIAFADSLKEIVEILTGKKRSSIEEKYFSYPVLDFTEEQKNSFLYKWDMTLGTMLQKLGTDVMRNCFNDCVWINSFLEKATRVPVNEFIMVTDVRFINEIAALKYRGCVCIRVEGDPLKAAENSTRNKIHQSEIELDNYDFDYVIKNNGTLEDLQLKIDVIVDKILTYDRHIYFTT